MTISMRTELNSSTINEPIRSDSVASTVASRSEYCNVHMTNAFSTVDCKESNEAPQDSANIVSNSTKSEDKWKTYSVPLNDFTDEEKRLSLLQKKRNHGLLSSPSGSHKGIPRVKSASALGDLHAGISPNHHMMIENNTPTKNNQPHNLNANTTPGSADDKTKYVFRVHSVPSLCDIGQEDDEEIMTPISGSTQDQFSEMNPDALVQTIIESNGYNPTPISALTFQNFFFEPTAQHISSYGKDIIEAVLIEDIAELRRIHQSGRTLQCCNKFGESIVHMACRRGLVEVLRFLLYEIRVTARLRDDFGRTPLHDACWTNELNLEIVKMLMDNEPALVVMSDKRGHTPPMYLKTELWGSWNRFLYENRELLVPGRGV